MEKTQRGENVTSPKLTLITARCLITSDRRLRDKGLRLSPACVCVCVETAFVKHISVILVSWCHREQMETYKEILLVSPPLIHVLHPPTELSDRAVVPTLLSRAFLSCDF